MQSLLLRNAFELFGLGATFDIDEARLEQRYLELVALFHPDRQMDKDEQERVMAQANVAHINDGYRALRAPLSRAILLLKEAGVAVDEEATIDDPELLLEAMEAREELERATDEQQLAKLMTKTKDDIQKVCTRLTFLFAQNSFDEAVKLVTQLRYLHRFAQNIELRQRAS